MWTTPRGNEGGGAGAVAGVAAAEAAAALADPAVGLAAAAVNGARGERVPLEPHAAKVLPVVVAIRHQCGRDLARPLQLEDASVGAGAVRRAAPRVLARRAVHGLRLRSAPHGGELEQRRRVRGARECQPVARAAHAELQAERLEAQPHADHVARGGRFDLPRAARVDVEWQPRGLRDDEAGRAALQCVRQARLHAACQPEPAGIAGALSRCRARAVGRAVRVVVARVIRGHVARREPGPAALAVRDEAEARATRDGWHRQREVPDARQPHEVPLGAALPRGNVQMIERPLEVVGDRVAHKSVPRRARDEAAVCTVRVDGGGLHGVRAGSKRTLKRRG